MGQQLADMLKRAGREAPSQALGRDLAFASRQLLKVGSCGQVAPLPPKCPSSRAPPFLWACVSLRSALLSLGEKHSDLLREECGLCPGAAGVDSVTLLRRSGPGVTTPDSLSHRLQVITLAASDYFCVSG